MGSKLEMSLGQRWTRGTALMLAVLALPVQAATYLRFADEAGMAHFGERLADGRVQPLDGAPWAGGQALGGPRTVDASQLLAPVTPRSVIAIGYNYPSHTTDRPDPTALGMFAKLPGSITGPGAVIPYPRRAKASDGFGPVGPWIVTDLDPASLTVKTFLNGTLKQSDAVKNLFFDFATIISEVSETIALEPGDIIFTGTPGTTEPMAPGDEVVVEVSGVGQLRNVVGSP
jgi:2-keto-4-pentenoate hydratase/2-oxohepta-3-ene-1,7-dioic acid hydratase in catechol pathway